MTCRLILRGLPLVVLGCGGSALAATAPVPNLTGRYAGTVTSRALKGALKGHWILDFSHHGRVAFRQNGKTVANENYSLSGTTITLAPVSTCRSRGRYAVELSGNKLQFRRQSDTCATRRLLLSYTFSKST